MSMKIPADWTFENKEIAEAFDNHVREQLPWYDLATGAVAHVARHYIPQNGRVYDIGASTGNIGKALAETLAARDAEFNPIESSADMAKLYNGPGVERLIVGDATLMEFEPFDLATVFLTLMFIPVADRRAFLRNLYARLRKGGALIIFDKTEAGTGYPATILWRLALAGKVATGANPADIVAKELSLGGVQRPLDVMDLADIGMPPVEFFRFGDFAGWIIEK